MTLHRLSLALAAVAALGLTSSAFAQRAPAQGDGFGGGGGGNQARLPPGVKSTFVWLGNGEPAVLYEPVNPGPKAAIAVMTEHSALDELATLTCTELSKRGYRVFCVNNSNDKSRDWNDGEMDRVNLETKKAVAYLRAYPGIKKIVLWGHSGGSTVVSSYQDVAENGVKACQEAAKIYKCPDSLANMPPADGIVFGDANWGIAPNVLGAIDPSVEIATGNKIVHPELNAYSPANGFNPKGTHYSPAFIKSFMKAQAEWNNRLVELALKKYADIKAGKALYADDEPFIIPGALFTGHQLYATDISILERTKRPEKLIHPDGSITTEVVHSVRVPTEPESPTPSLYRGALKTSVIGFLSTYAIRVDPDKYGYPANGTMDLTGIDWRSSRASPVGNVEGITVPILTMGMTGSFEMSVAEAINDHAKSKDKDLVYVEGATHPYPTCKPCEKTPGQYGDTVKTLYDYADKWLSQPGRFLP